MSNFLKNYELSIWEVNGYDETKLCVFGGKDILSPIKAQQPILKRNINGTKTLTFSLYLEYFDNIDNKFKYNPYCDLLVGGRLIKLFYDKKWYEFVITEINHTSENNKISYTAEDRFITELSKKGFNIELSPDFPESQGTIYELGEVILKGSDWEVDKKNSKIPPQLNEEVLVKLTTTQQIQAEEKAIIDSNNLLELYQEKTTIPRGVEIYTFYSTLISKNPFFQFFYLENQDYNFNEEGLLINCPLYSIDNYIYQNDLPKNTNNKEITTYKGRRLIRSQQSYFDSQLDTYVKVFKDSLGNEIIGYTKTEYLTDDFVANLVTNGKDFVSEVGWYDYSESCDYEVYAYPNAKTVLELLNQNQEIYTKNYLKISPKFANNWLIFNTGLEDNKNLIETMYSGQKFVIKLKAGYEKKGVELYSTPKELEYDKTTKQLKSGFKIGLCSYIYDEDGYPMIEEIFSSTELSGEDESVFVKENDYWKAVCTCYKDLSESELFEKRLGFFIGFEVLEDSKFNDENIQEYDFYIEDLQIFQFKEKEKEDSEDLGYYLPEDTIESDIKTKYYYFYRDLTFETADEITYLYHGYEEQPFAKVYYENYEQIRSVEQKESNIFNLIQTLCETFECWADFVVNHDDVGNLIRDKNKKPIKKILFKPYIGEEKWSGFRKGVNLKKLDRKTISSQVVTKTIVKDNSNEFAPNGFCSIARSEENPSGEGFIYDFRYYEGKELVNSEQLKKDLYDEKKGLYPNLKTINDKINLLIEQRVAISNNMRYLERDKEVKKAAISELSTLILTAKKDFNLYCGVKYTDFFYLTEEEQQSKLELAGALEAFANIFKHQSQLASEEEELEQINIEYKKAHTLYKTLTKENNNLIEKKKELILNFETKYTSYIQEGTWVSEEYVDHNLYYIDAKAVAATSAMPQVTYTIEVVDVSNLEEFLNYKIDLGDKTYVIDPDFFGYSYVDGLRTPNRQEVIISEITEDLDNEINNKFTVQNYKTQFDDLFQRITATTQQLKLNEGSYNRASGAFSNNGLDPTLTQNSLNSINFLLESNSIKWDVNGLVSTNLQNKHQFLKIHNGSIFLSDDGGATWGVGINGKGINANYIYAGQLDAGKINIVSELKTREDQQLEYVLSMDKDGLSMYSYEDTKKLRIRLGKLIDNDTSATELYGLQLYNKDGKATLKTDSNGDITISGTIYATDGRFKGTVYAANGKIGGWEIDTYSLSHYSNGNLDAFISTTNNNDLYMVNNYRSDDWRLLFGIEGLTGNFGVTSTGNLYANGVDIKDGNISFGDIFKITQNGQQSAVSYGLNIQLNPENENEQVVIESDDRVIGIREKLVDENGKEIKDSNGKSQWTWKTILGDLTNATLGGKPISEYGITGYGLCTENGLFTGTVIASSGRIGGWEVGVDYLYHKDNEGRRDVIFGKGKEKDSFFEYTYSFNKTFPTYTKSLSFYESYTPSFDYNEEIDFTSLTNGDVFPFFVGEGENRQFIFYIPEILEGYSYSIVFSRVNILFTFDKDLFLHGFTDINLDDLIDVQNKNQVFEVKKDLENNKTLLILKEQIKNRLLEYTKSLIEKEWDNVTDISFDTVNIKFSCKRDKEKREILYKSKDNPFSKEEIARLCYDTAFDELSFTQRLGIIEAAANMTTKHELQEEGESGVIKILDEGNKSKLKFFLKENGQLNFVRNNKEEDFSIINITNLEGLSENTLIKQQTYLTSNCIAETSLINITTSALGSAFAISNTITNLIDNSTFPNGDNTISKQEFSGTFIFLTSFIGENSFICENATLGNSKVSWKKLYVEDIEIKKENVSASLIYNSGDKITYGIANYPSFSGFFGKKSSTNGGVLYLTIPISKVCVGCTTATLEGILRVRTIKGENFTDVNLVDNKKISGIKTRYREQIGLLVEITFADNSIFDFSVLQQTPISCSFDTSETKNFVITLE